MASYLVSNKTFKNIDNISLNEALTLLENFNILGLDTETTGLEFNLHKLLLIQIGNEEIQIAFDITYFNNKIPIELKNFLESKRLFIGHNIKFDLKFLYYYGVIITKVYDTFLGEIITTNGLKKGGKGLKDVVLENFGDNLDKDVIKIILTRGITEEVIFYAWKDVVYLEKLMNIQLRKAKQMNLLKAIELDNNFVIVLSYIEVCGFYLNWESWEKKSKNDLKLLETNETKLNKWLGDNYPEYVDKQLNLWGEKINYLINWNSSKQVIQLFEKIGINITVFEKGVEKKSVEAPVLITQKEKFEIIPLYLEYKENQKVCSTYGLSWKNQINPKTNRIHTTFFQINDTGRLSCGGGKKEDEKKVNLQNIPSDKITRNCFQAQKGRKLINADYSGQEAIVLCNFSKEPNLINFYKKGLGDFHSYVASLIFSELQGLSVDEIKLNHKNKRNLAKSAGFAMYHFI